MRYLEAPADTWQRILAAVEASLPGMNQQELATHLQVSTATLRNMRAGQTRFDRGTVNRMAANLHWPHNAIQRMISDPEYVPESQWPETAEALGRSFTKATRVLQRHEGKLSPDETIMIPRELSVRLREALDELADYIESQAGRSAGDG